MPRPGGRELQAGDVRRAWRAHPFRRHAGADVALAGVSPDNAPALGAVVAEIASAGNLAPELVMHNFDFLLKYGYIEITDSV